MVMTQNKALHMINCTTMPARVDAITTMHNVTLIFLIRVLTARKTMLRIMF